MFFEVIGFSMFQHEQAVFFQQVVVENEVGQGFKLFEPVRRVGKDKVEPFAAPCMYLNTSPRTGRHLSVLSSFITLQMKA